MLHYYYRTCNWRLANANLRPHTFVCVCRCVLRTAIYLFFMATNGRISINWFTLLCCDGLSLPMCGQTEWVNVARLLETSDDFDEASVYMPLVEVVGNCLLCPHSLNQFPIEITFYECNRCSMVSRFIVVASAPLHPSITFPFVRSAGVTDAHVCSRRWLLLM